SKAYFDEVFGVVQEMYDLKKIFDDSDNKFAQNALYVYKLLEITSRFDKELARLKRENNVLSFEDLQHLTVGLLKDYSSLGSVYDAVFVDEYQDVNPTQEFIIQRLIKGECFMVGDVKQSIYGFRLADPKIFLARQERYKRGGGTAIDFNRNFRSARKILAFVNGVFNAVMTEKTADVDYKNTAAFELDGMPDGGRVEVHLFTDKRSERIDAKGLYDITNHVQAEEGVSASISEGKFIAREIKSLVGRAKGDGGYIGYGDIAILFRSRTRGAQQIIEVLRSEGIPVDESVFGKSASRPERELISMLRVLDNPRQDIPLAGFLLSFFGGYGEDELSLIAAQEGECLYDKVRSISCEADNENENKRTLAGKLRNTLSMLDTYRIKASFKNVSELMSGIISDFCYDAYMTREG
ncbi:MAG: UvrD-helicase domain-containing protein, partial [Clostridia bacterium]|nr:UvrD-helicase domain-containing protein [Clostridia bacterium]